MESCLDTRQTHERPGRLVGSAGLGDRGGDDLGGARRRPERADALDELAGLGLDGAGGGGGDAGHPLVSEGRDRAHGPLRPSLRAAPTQRTSAPRRRVRMTSTASGFRSTSTYFRPGGYADAPSTTETFETMIAAILAGV